MSRPDGYRVDVFRPGDPWYPDQPATTHDARTPDDAARVVAHWLDQDRIGFVKVVPYWTLPLPAREGS